MRHLSDIATGLRLAPVHPGDVLTHDSWTGRLDEAGQAARELLVRFPDVHDGYDRGAWGSQSGPAQCYRKVIEFVRAYPECYDSGFETAFQQLIAKLAPAAAAG